MDKKLASLGEEKRGLEERLRQFALVPQQQTDPDEVAEQIVKGIGEFKELFEQSTWEEKKGFVRAVVEQLVVDSEKGVGTLLVREFPVLELMRAGNPPSEKVAWAGFEPATFGL